MLPTASRIDQAFPSPLFSALPQNLFSSAPAATGLGAPSSMFGGPADASPLGMFGGGSGGINNALLLGGLGLMSGRNPREQLRGAAEGWVGGSELDVKEQEREDEEAQRKAHQEALRLVMEADDTVPEPVRELLALDPKLGTEFIVDRMKPPDMPASFREWQIAEVNPGFAQHLADTKGGTTVTLAGPKAYDTEVSKLFAGDYVDLQKGSRQASQMIGRLDRMEQLLQQPDVYTGAGGESVANAKRWADALGLDVGELGATDAIQAASNELALQMRNPAGGAGMPGAMSDKDREFLQSIPPGLLKTPEGNRLAIDYLRRLRQRDIDVANLANEYMAQNNGQIDAGFYTYVAEWADANPLFADIQPAQAATPAAVSGRTSTGVPFTVRP